MIGQVVGDGRFRIDAELKQGGMGNLYRATDQERGDACVVKELDLARIDDLKAMELFEREIAVLEGLDHPQIPGLRAHFAIEGQGQYRMFLAQDLIEGQDLETLRASGRVLSTSDVLSVGRQMLGVLGYLHRRRPPIIHRDIKPGNIVLRPDGVPCLVDFGAVRNTIVDSQLGGSTVVGTFGYMAPEQLRGHAEPATDHYSLGATLLFLLTGRDPSDFDQEALKLDIRKDSGLSEPIVQLLEAMLEPDVDLRKSLIPQLSRGFDRVARGSLPFLPDDGPVSAEAFARASVDGLNQALPQQVQDILTPEIVQLADDLRDVQITIDRKRAKLDGVKENISFLDKLNFLHATPAEVRAKAIKKEVAELDGTRRELEGRFDEAVERRAMMNPLYAMRRDVDRVIEAIDALEVDDDKEKKARKVDTDVYGLDDVFDALGRVEDLFQEYTGVQEDFEDLSARISKAAGSGKAKHRDKAAKGLSTMEAEIVQRAIDHLTARGYADHLARVEELEDAYADIDKKHKKARRGVSLTDWINFFDDSPEEVKLKALANQLGGVYADLAAARRRVQELLRSTLQAEALLGALFTMEAAREAVDAIHAEPRERTERIRKVKSDGSVKYKEKTYWVAELVGAANARHKAQEAGRAVWGVLGRPLTFEEVKAVIMKEA